MRLVYAANVLVAGTVGALTLFTPTAGSRLVYSDTAPPTTAMQMAGALWLAIAVLSLAGLFRPLTFSPVLLLQLLYKGGWLIVVALPAWLGGRAVPGSMTTFFVVWVLLLPFVIPWQHLFGDSS